MHRTWAVIGVALLAAVLYLLAMRCARHRGRFAAGGLLTATVVTALILVGAPYGQDARTIAGVSFVLHCPGRFSDDGGQEHPPAGTESVCRDSAKRRLAAAGGLVAVVVAAVGATALIRRNRSHEYAR